MPKFFQMGHTNKFYYDSAPNGLKQNYTERYNEHQQQHMAKQQRHTLCEPAEGSLTPMMRVVPIPHGAETGNMYLMVDPITIPNTLAPEFDFFP